MVAFGDSILSGTNAVGAGATVAGAASVVVASGVETGCGGTIAEPLALTVPVVVVVVVVAVSPGTGAAGAGSAAGLTCAIAGDANARKATKLSPRNGMFIRIYFSLRWRDWLI